MQAVQVLNCLQSMIHVHPKITFDLLVLVYRGSKRKEVLAKSFQNIPQYGKGKNIFSDSSLQHFIQMLISENIIAEKLRGTNECGSTPFLIPGDKAVAPGELLIYKYKCVPSCSRSITHNKGSRWHFQGWQIQNQIEVLQTNILNKKCF